MRLSAILTAAIFMAAASGVYAAEVKVWNGEYVPPPKPVATKARVGVYIFPGWYRDAGKGDYPYPTHDEFSEWKRCIATQPKPRPLLGFYDDSLPEVNDWHTLWALEHGVSFFAFDWYWNAGEHRLMRTLEHGFLKAKYSPLMKFCIHWCNHSLDWKTRKLDFSREALLEMTKYLADRYFQLPNYLTVDGRPVLMVWAPRSIVASNDGPDGFKLAIGEMNVVLRAKGIKDIYLVAIGTGEPIEKAGFDATTAYCYYGTDLDSPYQRTPGHSVPYEEVVKHYETMWRQITGTKHLPYIVPIGTNWDDRPRARERGFVITGKSPEKFRTMCVNSLKYLDKNLKMAIIEAWNEWGEGSILEPDREFRFGFLDAVREVFADAPAEHTDYVPEEKRLLGYSVLSAADLAAAKVLESQPYPDPPPGLRTIRWKTDQPLPTSQPLKAWEFNSGNNEGWFGHQLDPFKMSGGVLATRSTGDDPQIITDNVGVPIEEIGCVALRLRVSNGVGSCEVFWTTTSDPKPTADKAFQFPVAEDGEWHTYQVCQKIGGKWQGILKNLRFDTGGPGDVIEVDWIRIYGK